MCDAAAKPDEKETKLIALLKSPDPDKVIDALDRLPSSCPDSTNAVREIVVVLKSQRKTSAKYPPNIITRRAARALGDYGATLEWDEIAIIAGLLRSQDANEVCDGLKALRGLSEPAEIQLRITGQLLPLLNDPDNHIVRDACRTLAVHGTRDVIPALEPLTKHRRADVRMDAKDAIAVLEAKP